MSPQKAENEILTLPANDVEKRFWSRIQRSEGVNDCWNWIGHVGTHGYGRLTVHYRDLLAHRVAFVLANGPIPDNLWVLHACDNPACCRPDHLFLGTNQENTADRTKKGRSASGLRNGNFTKPDRRPSGDRHWTRVHPDMVPKGEAVSTARLTEADVLDIRRHYDTGDASLAALSRQYGMTKQGIWLIVKRRNWKHVP